MDQSKTLSEKKNPKELQIVGKINYLSKQNGKASCTVVGTNIELNKNKMNQKLIFTNLTLTRRRIARKKNYLSQFQILMTSFAASFSPQVTN